MKFEEAKIYKLIDNTNENVYIGSTCKALKQRLAKHVSHYKDYTKGGKSSYVSSYIIIQNGDYDIMLIEDYPCKSKDELLTREGYWTNKIPCINKIKNQGIIKIVDSIYASMWNIEDIKEKGKIYYIENKQIINDKNKLYRDQNKIKLQEKKKEYREEHYEKLNEKCQCPCGGSYTIMKGKARHLKTIKHLQWVENNEKH